MATAHSNGGQAALRERGMGELVKDLSGQMSTLVRQEVELAKVELAEKGKKAGLGVGLFSVAGLLAFFAFGTLVATAILALALALPAWLSALIVAVVLLAAAGVAALVGKKEVQQATPATPERTMAGVQKDKAAMKGQHV